MPNSTVLPRRRSQRCGSVSGGTRYLLTIAVASLSGCGTTSHFVEKPALEINGAPGGARQAVAQLLSGETPYTIKLCEADPSSKQCMAADQGISATGVGGLFIPLVLHVHGMRVSQQHPSADGLTIQIDFDSNADGIPPICATADGTVATNDKTALIEASNFYCNWMAVGNVLVNADLSIDGVDLKARTFTGYYKLVFHGTGNVSGSGYYRAAIVPAALKTS